MANELASICGKNNVENRIKKTEEGDIVMINVNKERVNAVISNVGLQLPKVRLQVTPCLATVCLILLKCQQHCRS